jgi:Spy/CpxP family protein refolding chaperone
MNLRVQAGVVLFLLLPWAPINAQNRAYEAGAPGRIRTSGFQGDREKEREKARQQIGISVQQQEQLTRLYAEADKKEKAIGKELHDLYEQQRTLYSAYVIDHGQERDLHKKMEQMHSQLLQLHADTEDGLRKLLTREQFERLNAALNDHRRENRRDKDRRNGSIRDREQKALHLNDSGPNPAEKASLSAQSKEEEHHFRFGPAHGWAG